MLYVEKGEIDNFIIIKPGHSSNNTNIISKILI